MPHPLIDGNSLVTETRAQVLYKDLVMQEQGPSLPQSQVRIKLFLQ